MKKQLLSTALSFEVVESATLGIEYAHAEDYTSEKSDAITLQLAAEF
jgi:hypothetical protein